VTLLSWHHLARRLSGWLLAALMLATLAPAISRTLAGGPPQDGQDWVELCTSRGMQWVRLADAVADPASDPTAPATGALDLCGHCTLAAERFAPLLPTFPVVAATSMRWSTPGYFSAATHTLAGPQPAARGPPLLS
jgi:Protein of unknown function (DUF2946)